MGMVRSGRIAAWRALFRSYSEALPDFVKLAEAYGLKGIRCSDPSQLDAAIQEMIDSPRR